jgi:NAD-dependent dihydropyrimidine dehydrogenase PreA subunit
VTTYVIDPDTCIQCGACEADCPDNAIFEGPNGYTIDQAKCTGCGTCLENCPSESPHPVD